MADHFAGVPWLTRALSCGVEITKFWRPWRGGARFLIKKDHIDQEAWELYKTKVVGNDSSYCLESY